LRYKNSAACFLIGRPKSLRFLNSADKMEFINKDIGRIGRPVYGLSTKIQ